MQSWEAAAALRALGPQLAWGAMETLPKLRGGHVEIHSAYAEERAGLYLIGRVQMHRLYSRKPKQRCVFAPTDFYIAEFKDLDAPTMDEIRTFPCPRRYRTLADARAACERHLATGKWGKARPTAERKPRRQTVSGAKGTNRGR